jgi:type II secretory pathway component GspD/PulD (secretin)
LKDNQRVMRVSVAACAFGLLVVSARPVRAEVSVRVAAGKVDIKASAAPLAEVLRRLAEQTGMKVLYEGAEPRELVTASLPGRSPVEAVNELLKDRGLNYALAVHATGRIETLIIVTAVRPVAPKGERASTPAKPSAPAPAVDSLVDLLERVGSPVGEKLREEQEAGGPEAKAVPLPDLLERLSEPTVEESPVTIPEGSALRRLLSPEKPPPVEPDPPAAPAEPPPR